MKPHVLFTASDAKYGDFLIEHWFASLREHADLSRIEVVVLDYGLSLAQRHYLAQNGVQVAPCIRDGHVAIVRFRDMAAFLEQHSFAQAILSDSGDIIFQDDIAPILDRAPDRYRGVTEDLRPPFGVFLTDEFFAKEDRRRIRQLLRDAPMVNAGFILGPASLMAALGREVDQVLLSKDRFGPDQLVVNAVFRREGYQELPRDYNFVVATARALLDIRDGRIYADGRLVPVVHNSGNLRFLRPLENFGYGPDHNLLKKDVYHALQALHSTSDSLIEAHGHLVRRLKSLQNDLTHAYQASFEQLEQNGQALLRHFHRNKPG